MTPDELIRMNPREASAMDCMALMKLAHDDVTLARDGKLFTPDGVRITPDMNKWGNQIIFTEDEEEGICPSCLAGSPIVSRVGIGYTEEKCAKEFRAAKLFLDSCRYIPLNVYEGAYKALRDKGVVLPSIRDLGVVGGYNSRSTSHVLKTLKWVFEHNTHLMPVS